MLDSVMQLKICFKPELISTEGRLPSFTYDLRHRSLQTQTETDSDSLHAGLFKLFIVCDLCGSSPTGAEPRRLREDGSESGITLLTFVSYLKTRG